MDFGTFFDISCYGNREWKGHYTTKEVAENAYDYTCEFIASKQAGEPTHTIRELAKLLAEDGTDKCKEWLYDLAMELKLIDMTYPEFKEKNLDITTLFSISCEAL